MDSSELKNKLKQFIINEVIKDETYPLKDDEPLITGGLIDSFALVSIAVFIEKELGINIPDTELTIENMDSITKMMSRILEK